MPDERTIDDIEREDEDDSTPPGIVRRLNRVAKIIERANLRLDRISSVLVNPPEPDKPAIRAALVEVKTQAQAAVTKADDMLRRLG